MDSFYKLRKELLGDTEPSEENTQPETFTWNENSFIGLRQSLLQQGEQNDQPRKNALSDWVNRYNSTIQGISDYDKKRAGGYTRDASGGYSADVDALIRDFGNIRSYADRLGLENSQQYLQALKDLQSSIARQNEYFAQWDTEDAYNSYLSQQKKTGAFSFLQDPFAGTSGKEAQPDPIFTGTKQEKASITEHIQQQVQQQAESQKAYNDMAAYDLEQGKADIQSLEAQLQEYREAYYGMSFAHDNFQDNKDKVSALETQYGKSMEKLMQELEQKISEAKAYWQQAQWLQKGIRLAGVADENSEYYDPAFSQYAVSGVWKGLTLDQLEQVKQDYQKTMSLDASAPGKIEHLEDLNAQYGSLRDVQDAIRRFQYMTEDEARIYNYYLDKDQQDGTDLAEQYRDSLNLEAREGQRIYEDELKGNKNTLKQITYQAKVGWDSFKSGLSGLKKLVGGKEEYKPPSAVQVAGSLAREDLGDIDLKYFNFAKGEWDDAKIFGSSLGQVAGDLVSTTANMAPSIITSSVVGLINPAAGAAAGSVLLGASATGNAYQQMINLGYGKEQAGSYAALVGASEAGLQYLLGGIGKLGGVVSGGTVAKIAGSIDNAFLRVSAKLGGKMLSEGLEEGLQEILTPWFKNLALHVDEDIDWNSFAYSSLLGALSAGVMEGKSTVSSELATIRSETSTQASGAQPQQQAQADEQIIDNTTPVSPQSPTAPQQAAPATRLTSEDLTDIVDEAVAKQTSAPADPLAAALESAAQTGTVTNKQAKDIMNNTRAVQRLVNEAGLKELNGTASQNRESVKQAVLRLSQQQAAVDTTQNTDYDNINTTQGGAVNGTEQNAPTLDSGRIAGPAGIQSEARAENGNRPGIQSLMGEDATGFGQTVPNRPGRGLSYEQSNLQSSVGPFAESDYYMPEQNSALGNAQRTFKDEYGLDCRTVKASAWSRKNPAFIRNGVVYVSEGIDADTLKTLVPHESTHAIAQSRFAPYTDFLARSSDMIDAQSESGQTLLSLIAEHCGIDLFSMDDAQQAKLFSELNATIYGMHKGGILDMSEYSFGELVSGAFPDFNGYIAELDSIHEQYRAQVKANSAPQTSPTESVGAAPAGFDMNTHLQYEHGTISEGENPVRPDDLPKRDIHGDKVSETARTVKGAKVTPDEFVDLLNKDTTEGGMSYIPITNNKTTQKAMDYIMENGWEEAKGAWSAAVRNGKAGADLVAQGALLLNNAAKAGDKQAWLDILHDYQSLGTNTAQGLQALRILKTLSPDDKLYMAQRSVQKMVADMHLDTEITIDEALQEEYRAAETDKQRDAVLKKIQKNVASQLPSTFMEKFTALRYVNMLGNLRTQIRNVAGNLGMKAVRSVQNTVASSIESIASGLSGGKLKRTRSAFVSKAQKAAAANDFDTVKSAVLDGGKYNDSDSAFDSTEFAKGVQEERRIFKFAPLEGYRKATNWMMEQGDVIFAKSAYARALAGYLKANGITETDYSKVDTAVMEDARLFAVKEAQEATFRDTNWLSGWVSKVGRRKDTPAAVKVVSEGIMPFRKTPANVLVRAEEYSPLGVINSVVNSVRAMQKDSDVTGAQVINSWAKTLTGTGIFGLGMLLSNLGILSAGPDDDEDKDAFESLNGWQNYALTLPDGTNLTIDFLSPSAMPMLMGAQLMEMINDGGFSLKDLESALTSLADPMIEMSMLQGVSDTLDNIQYAENNLGQLLATSCLNYLTQGLTNTLLGQLERTFEDSRMQTYVDKDSAVPDWLQRIIGKASAKVPGWDYQQIPYINAWGEEEENPEWYVNGAYNVLSPAYIEKGVSSDLTEELNRLNEAQGDVNVYPSAPAKTVTYNDTTYNLPANEYVSLAKAQGQKQKDLVESIIANDAYAALSDEEKAAAISYAYDYARDYARGEVLEDHPGVATAWMVESQDNIAEGILRHVAQSSLTDALSAVVSSWKEQNGSEKAIAGLEQAYTTFANLSADMQKAILADSGGRLGYYLAAKDAGISTDTFASLYKTFYDIDNSGSNTSEKASQWSYALEKAQENGTLTYAQKNALKEEMSFWQMIPAETKKFDDLTGSGISADASAYIVDLVKSIKPLPGNSGVKDYQTVQAITGADDQLTDEEQKIVLQCYLSEKAYDKYLDILDLGLDNDEYAAACELYSLEDAAGGQNTKQRTIARFQREFHLSYDVAKALYEIYKPA